MSEPMRIHRALARAGVASRRHAEELVAAGRVLVNGAVARTGQSVDPAHDRITVDGRQVAAPVTTRWYVLHKPAGVLTTRAVEQGRRTVFDLVPNVPGLTYVGRLDFMTEGVLLLTTDGTAAHLLTHPSSEVERSYIATVRGDAPAAAEQARDGVELEDGPVRAQRAVARSLGRGRWELELTIAEGRTREIRRLCEALGLEVERLVRTRFGPVQLGELPAGQWRGLTPPERRALGGIVGAEVPVDQETERRDAPARGARRPARPRREKERTRTRSETRPSGKRSPGPRPPGKGSPGKRSPTGPAKRPARPGTRGPRRG